MNPNPKIGVEFVIKTLKDNTLMFYIQPLPAGRLSGLCNMLYLKPPVLPVVIHTAAQGCKQKYGIRSFG